jgi:lysophospholipase L1-like esterase
MEANLPNFLALGDSYTIGESVPEEERWPNQLASMLREEGTADLARPDLIAQTGWTSDELMAAIAERRPKGPYNLVSLLVGVNNQYRGRGAAEYGTEFEALLETAIKLAGGKRERVFVVSIPDWGVTPFAEGRDRGRIAAEIDAFNAVNFDESVRAGVGYVDVTSVSRRAATESALVAPDGLHPSGVMYREWAELVLPVARGILDEQAVG